MRWAGLVMGCAVVVVGCAKGGEEFSSDFGDIGDGADGGTRSSSSGDAPTDSQISATTMPPTTGITSLGTSTGPPGTTADSGSSSTGVEDIDLVCDGPPANAMCASPSPYTSAGACDPFAQDCPAGEKCVPWADDGGTTWNSTRCSPVAIAPGQLGDACTAVTSGTSGEDDCDVGLMCWNVDAFLVGTCLELCSCGPVAPVCAGGGTTCVITNDGTLPTCAPSCDPLDIDADCPAGELCVPGDEYFFCIFDASGTEGAVGEECQFLNGCDRGLMCTNAALVPGCPVGAAGCCMPFCDTEEPNTCPIAGTECNPFFAAGTEPEACHTDTGVCSS